MQEVVSQLTINHSPFTNSQFSSFSSTQMKHTYCQIVCFISFVSGEKTSDWTVGLIIGLSVPWNPKSQIVKTGTTIIRPIWIGSQRLIMPFIADNAHFFHCDEPLANGLIQERQQAKFPSSVNNVARGPLRNQQIHAFARTSSAVAPSLKSFTELHRGHTEIHGEKMGERVFSDSFSQQMGTGESDQIFSMISVNLCAFSV